MMNRKFWRDRNVFITGATGFLGAHLTEQLIEYDANVVALVRDNVPNSRFHTEGACDKVTSVTGNVEDYFLIERILNEYEIDSCFHLAAQTIVGTANRSPLSTFESNIKGTWSVLEASRASKLIERIVIASSDKAYGTHEKMPYTEEAVLKGEHPYDVSKSCADLIANAYHETYGIPLSITRCANFYGGGDLNFNRIVPGTAKSLIFGKQPIIRSDGTLLRDYLYIKDAVSAYLTLGEATGKKNATGEAFNFGWGKPQTVLKIVETLIDISGEKLKPKILNEAKNEIKKQYLDSSKARRILKWAPKYGLKAGLSETYRWYKNFLQ